MRWRRLAARVWPTDTDSTKPTMLISSAATKSWLQSPLSKPGRVRGGRPAGTLPTTATPRSEEHTSELQSRGHLVCRLLLEKKKEAKNHIFNKYNINKS